MDYQSPFGGGQLDLAVTAAASTDRTAAPRRSKLVEDRWAWVSQVNPVPLRMRLRWALTWTAVSEHNASGRVGSPRSSHRSRWRPSCR